MNMVDKVDKAINELFTGDENIATLALASQIFTADVIPLIQSLDK